MVALYIPISYSLASQEEEDEICNGCGSKDGIKFPSSFLGVSIKKACQIHDWMFAKGLTMGDYVFANAVFLWNMTAIIMNESRNLFMILARSTIALYYFLGVMSRYGGDAYWVEKDRNEYMNITIRGEFLCETLQK